MTRQEGSRQTPGKCWYNWQSGAPCGAATSNPALYVCDEHLAAEHSEKNSASAVAYCDDDESAQR